MALPDAFFGSWTVDKNENFDEFLASVDVPWPIRKAVILAGHNITYTNLGNGRYRAEHSSMGRTCKYEFTLDEEFEMTGMEGIQHKVTATMEGSTFVEWHLLLDKPDRKQDKHVFTMENGRLVQCLTNGKVSCKRYFKKKN